MLAGRTGLQTAGPALGKATGVHHVGGTFRSLKMRSRPSTELFPLSQDQKRVGAAASYAVLTNSDRDGRLQNGKAWKHPSVHPRGASKRELFANALQRELHLATVEFLADRIPLCS
jgi:hypothetical protein